MALNNLTGKRFGRLSVIERGINYRRAAQWVCLCDCGVVKTVRGQALVTGSTVSCGCFHKEQVTTHGLTDHPLHATWMDMMTRCYNESNHSYKNYGARGITVCDRWKDVRNFIEDIPLKPSQTHSLERLNNSKGYEPGNCVWATKLEQARNRRNNIRIKFENKITVLSEFCATHNLPYELTRQRLSEGWSIGQFVDSAVQL